MCFSFKLAKIKIAQIKFVKRHRVHFERPFSVVTCSMFSKVSIGNDFLDKFDIRYTASQNVRSLLFTLAV